MEIQGFIKQVEQQMKEQDSIYHNCAVKFGLSDTAMWVLYIVSDTDQICTQQDLCNQYCFAKQTINTAINNLAKDGYVILEPIQGTRNRKKIVLTEKGKALTEGTIDILKKAEIAAYGTLSEEELSAFLNISTRLNAALREETEKLFRP